MVTKITSHRGLSDIYPENTLLAFKEAIKAGSKRIELDLQSSKDRVIFIHHDYALGNPDNGKGLLYNQSSQYIQTLTIAGSEQIPTLEEVVQSLGNGIEYEMELKGLNAEFLENVVKICKKYNVLSNTEFTSSNISLLIKLKEFYPEVITGLFLQKYPEWMSPELGLDLIQSQLSLSGATIAHAPLDIINEEFIDRLHSNGFKVHAANCDSEEDLSKAFKLGVDQLSTNFTKRALKIAGELSKSK